MKIAERGISTLVKAVIMLTSALCVISTDSAADENDFRMRLGERMLNAYVKSSRTAGLGGSYAAINEGGNGTYQNPASLGAQNGHEVINELSVERIKEGSKDAYYTTVIVGGSINFNTWKPDFYNRQTTGNRSLGFSFSHTNGRSKGSDGLSQGTNKFNLAYGRSFNYGRVLAGIGAGLISTKINDNDWYDLDIGGYEIRSGAILRVTRAFSVGAVFAFGFGDFEDNQPSPAGTRKGDWNHREMRLGASMQLTDRWMVSGDIVGYQFERAQKTKSPREIEEHDIVRLSFGSELIVIPERLTTRGGVFVENDEWDVKNIPGISSGREKTHAGLSGGLSYYKENWSLGTSHEMMTNGDHGHHMNFMLDF
ncbi:MAG: hypothetical protein ACYTFY_02665 [Planctomycetota bacterium]|jgi:hypothetical protein